MADPTTPGSLLATSVAVTINLENLSLEVAPTTAVGVTHLVSNSRLLFLRVAGIGFPRSTVSLSA